MGVVILLSTPSVQHKIAAFVTEELRKQLNTEVSIGNVNIGLLNRIIIDDVLLKDRTGKEMMKVTRLSAKFNPLSLLKGKIIIGSVQLFGFNIALSKQTPQSSPNFQFVIDAFASKDTIKEESNIDLRINSILIRRGKMSYNVLSEPETPGIFNAQHVQLQNIIANVSLKALRKDSLNAYIKRLSFEEQSGFELKKLSMRALADTKRLKIDNFNVDLPATSLIMDSMLVVYDSLEALRNPATSGISFKGELKGTSITLKDVSSFVPAFSSFSSPIQLDLRFNGTMNQLNCPYLEIKAQNKIELLADVAFQDLTKGEDAYVYGNLSRFHITNEGIHFLYRNLMGEEANTPPIILTRLQNISFNGNISGYFNDLVTYGTFSTGIGSIRTDLKISSNKEKRVLSYSGAVKTDGFDLGKLLDKEDKLGKTSFNINLKGVNHYRQWPDLEIKGLVSSIEYNKYDYRNIALDGLFRQGGFDGKIEMQDENGSLLLNGSFNLAQPIPTFNLKAQINNIRPYNFHLTDKYKDTEFSLKVGADFSGNSIDNIIGEINVDSFTYKSPEKEYFLDNLKVKASPSGDKKILEINSSFMNATIVGNYSYHTVPVSVMRAFEKYIPSLLSVNKNKKETHNDFTFNIDIYNTEILPQVFNIPLELTSHSTIKGFFNDNAGKLRLEGYFPHIKYGGKRFESGLILCETISDRFRCNIRGTSCSDSQKKVNISLETIAKDDKLNTSLYWGNNTEVTYSGSISALAHFYKTEGEKPILQTNIDILPSTVILNDTVWNIHPSHVAIDSGRVFIDNFLFEHKDQYLRIDGKITKEAKDTVKVQLNKINLRYVFEIINFHAVDFQGMASGSVTVSQTLKDPIMDARINVGNFTFNGASMGELNAYGAWDKEQEGIFLDARMKEKNISSTRVKGFILPKKKGLDLHIEADSTNLGFLGFFMKSIASEVKGRTTGHVRLFGGFKSLNLEGNAIADASFKINILNTSFFLKRDSVRLIPNEIRFRDAMVYDAEGHQGKVNGSLYHNELKDLSYRFQIETNNMLVFNTKESPDIPFYGTIYGTGNVLLNGNPSRLNVDVAMSTNRNTNFVYLTQTAASATSNQFITYVDKTPKRIVRDTLELQDKTDFAKKEDNTPIDIRLNLQIDATPDATMKIVMDPISGDYISGKGEGNIRVDFFNKGDVKMFGNYTINQGVYKFSLQEIIRKDFNIRSGSSIAFSGNPLDANMDIQATYTVNSASLSDLGLSENFAKNNVKVNCVMNLTGVLLKPSIRFDLDLPNVNEEERELVKSAVSTEEQMNMQILYLLGIGKFYTYDYATTDRQSSNAMSSVLSSTLSGQINNMFSQIINNNNWNFGTNLSTGEKGWTDMEFEGMLSGQLLNNRLLINGNFGYRDNPLANTNFVGDFEIEWLLTKSGELRLKAYNQANDRYYAKTTLTTQGIGVIYKKDFNTWRDLLIWHIRKKNQAKKEKDIAKQPETQKKEKDKLPSAQ